MAFTTVQCFYELFVLEGATQTLKINNPLLCIECARRNKEELEYVKKINDFLVNLGYKIVGGVGKELFFKVQIDVICGFCSKLIFFDS